ncbi:ubinuclein-1-like isoform X1 [Solanum lycopersicum]|uniref:ubinuclein-1-like isoform X1 n=1 Tax=Solanum lycopersicum TaxID=4081 RepID=UPI0008FEC20F|nr:ubinuclein-1-like isoform X1 [Solanum lycopersicum]
MDGGFTGGEPVGRASTSYEAAGGRRRFTVELRPGETTIVSWKKLLKDANKSNVNVVGSGPTMMPVGAPASIQTPVPHPALEARLAPGQPADKEVKDAPPGNRLNAVIEKIERLYVGKQSDDEEDLNDFPDDDEYDTEDSFIDDTELDEYFQVDNSAIKHDGFFVNRGKLERIEPVSPKNQQPKKRRRKDLAKSHVGDDDGHNPSKPVKVGKKAGKLVPVVSETSHPSHGVALQNVSHEEKFPNQLNVSEIPTTKKAADTQDMSELSPSASLRGNSAEEKDLDQQKIGVTQSKNLGDKLKDGSEISGKSSQRLHDRSSYAQEKSNVGRSVNISDGIDQSVQRRDEKFNVSGFEGKNSGQTMVLPKTIQKDPAMQRKEGSSGRPKGTMLEKAIRDLEKIVAELRPPNMEVQDADNSSQAIKRRLPLEIKQRLAKVARLAQASHGKISNELISRLMSIVGHLIQLRTLKRNLKIMVNMGLSAKQEKDNRVQHIKREVAEMIKLRIPVMKSKLLEQQAGASDDFQEASAEEKEAFKRKYSMDVALEDKICDLYDHFVEGLDEDAGPQVRKLYAELAGCWPNGFMDNHGIKRAICRAKDRRRALHARRKDGEKIRRNKLLATKEGDTSRVDAGPIAQSVHIQEKIVVDHSSTSTNKPVYSSAAVNASARVHVSIANGSDVNRLKQEKLKGVSGSSVDPRGADAVPKKKVKRKHESELGESLFHSEKLTSTQAEEKNKTNKHTGCPTPKPNNVSTSGFEQLT